MSEVFSIVAYVKARVDEAKRDFATFQQSVDNSKQSLDNLGTAGDVAAGILIQQFSQNVVRAFETFGRVTVESFADFELATARIIATTGVTGDELIELTGIIEESAMTLGTDFGVGAASAMSGLESLVKAGLDPATEATQALEGVLQLATIEQINAADAANMVVAAMTQYGLKASDATRIVDGFVQASAAGIDTAAGYASGLANVGARASAMGFSMEETLAALVQIDASQKDARRSGTFLNRMLIDLADKAEDAGINLYNADGSMRSMDEIITELRVKVQGFGDDQHGLNLFLGDFQSRAQTAILSLVKYDGTIAETETKLTSLSGAQETANVILDTYSGRLAVADAKQESAAIGMGGLTSELSIMSAEFMASLGPVGLLADSLGPPVLSGVMQGVTMTFIPMMIKTLGQMVTQMGVAATASTILGGAINVMSGPIGWVALAVGALALAWSNDWGGIQEKTGAVIDFIMEKIAWVTDGITAFGDSVRGILGWVGNQWEALTTTVDEQLRSQVGSIEQSLDEELNAIEDSYAEQVALTKESYKERQTNIDAALSDQLAVSETHYEDLKKQAEEAHETALTDLQEYWLASIDETVEGWESVVDEYEGHYADIISETTESYDTLLSETETFYDDMIVEQSAFLVAIREGRSRDLDDLELNFLLKKQALDESHESGRISTEQYEDKLSKLEKKYRDEREDVRDTYRIQELQAEETFRTEEERINEDRATALKGIEQEKADEIKRINEEQNAAIQLIRDAEAELEEQHVKDLEQLALDHAAEQDLITLEANREQQRLTLANQVELTRLEKQLYTDLETAGEEHAAEVTDTWGSMWDDQMQTTRTATGDIETTVANMDSNLATSLQGLRDWASDVVDAARNAYNKAKAWWDKIASGRGGGGDTDVVVDTDGTVVPDVDLDAGDTSAQDIAARIARGEIMAQHGFDGWVTQPTRFLAGEAGAEYVSVTPIGDSPKMAGRTTIIHGPLLTVEGSADEKTAKLAAKLIMSELRKY